MLIHFRRHVLVLRRPRAGPLLLDKPIATPQHTVAIQHLFVFPDMQKQGVGSQLLADAEQVTKTLFPSVIQIHATVPSNIGVFFEKNGFELNALLGDNLLATKQVLKQPPPSTNDGVFVPIDIAAAAYSDPQDTRENTKGMEEDSTGDSH